MVVLSSALVGVGAPLGWSAMVLRGGGYVYTSVELEINSKRCFVFLSQQYWSRFESGYPQKVQNSTFNRKIWEEVLAVLQFRLKGRNYLNSSSKTCSTSRLTSVL